MLKCWNSFGTPCVEMTAEWERRRGDSADRVTWVTSLRPGD